MLKSCKSLRRSHHKDFIRIPNGASAISSNGCLTVKNIKNNHIKWEKENGFNPYEDWSNDNEAKD